VNHIERAEPNRRVRAPVFIVGSPRSGTTLLRVTLNRHPQLAVLGETAYFRRVYDRRKAFGDPADLQVRDRIVTAYLAIEPVRRLGMNAEVLRERLMREGVSWRELFASMLRTYAESQGKPHAGEKTPRHALHVHTLCEWFPDCTIVHLVRDPRAAVCSMIRMPWACRSVLMGARTWRLFNAAALAVSGRCNYVLIKYEDLVTHPEEQVRRLCNHIGLEYTDAVLSPDPAEMDPRRPVHRAYEKVTSARMELWGAQLQPWQVSTIEAAAGHLMGEFGYQRRTRSATAASMARAAAEALVEMTVQKLIRSPSVFYHFLQPTNLADEEKWIARASATYGRLRLHSQADARQPAGAGIRD
jgi:sulfotransferase family protein